MTASILRAAIVASAALAAAAQAAPPAAEYVAKAGASDIYEQQSSKLVLATTKDAKLRAFAQEMVTDHGKSTAEVKAAAMKAGMTPAPPKLDMKQAGMIKQLTAATGPARDKMYVMQQKTAHTMALALQKDYAASGDKAPLKIAAAGIVPVVEHHIKMLSGM